MRTETKQILILTFIAALLVVITSCSVTKGKEIGERAVVQFHNQFNAGQYHDIYSQTDEGFRKGTSESDTLALFDAVHRKLGTVKNANQTEWHVNATTAGTVVTLTYNTEFTEGHANEQFVFYVTGDSARLFHYNVNSPLLITK
ncbi:MAG TPA: hypothetical protein VN951_03125 [Pyrinomonadaceae bacterium]|nr:hypothetical protein [Pyrinomonadaceae bacterium]